MRRCSRGRKSCCRRWRWCWRSSCKCSAYSEPTMSHALGGLAGSRRTWRRCWWSRSRSKRHCWSWESGRLPELSDWWTGDVDETLPRLHGTRLDHRQLYWTRRVTGQTDRTGNLPQREKNFLRNRRQWEIGNREQMDREQNGSCHELRMFWRRGLGIVLITDIFTELFVQLVKLIGQET